MGQTTVSNSALHVNTSTIAFQNVKKEQTAFLLSSSSLLSSLSNTVAKCYGLSLLDTGMHIYTHRLDRVWLKQSIVFLLFLK